MKVTTKVEKKEVEIKTTVYTCEAEGCDYSTTSHERANSHYGLKHAVIAEWIPRDEDLEEVHRYLKFLTEEDFHAWNSANNGSFGNRWIGPVWYAVISEETTCGRGCGCTEYYLKLVPAQQVLESLTRNVNELRNFLEATS